MKLKKLLVEQGNNPVMRYQAEYMWDKGVGRWVGENTNQSFEEAVADAEEEYEGSVYHPGVWVGFSFGDVSVGAEADEDGSYERINLEGDACIIVVGEMEPNHPLFRKVGKDIQIRAEELVDASMESDRDDREHRRNPSRFYGVNKRDFM